MLSIWARSTDQDVVVDGDLVTGRSGAHCHLFAKKIIEMLALEKIKEVVDYE